MRWWWSLGALVGCVADAPSSLPPTQSSPAPWTPPPPATLAPPSTTPTTDPELPVTPMWGFSFIDATLAGMPLPRSTDYPYLQHEGLGLLVSAMETPVDPEELAFYGIDGHHLPIDDFEAPTLDQQAEFVGLVRERRERAERVGVHCLAGRGRTGTLLATWLVSEGRSAEEAVLEVRTARPGSIESVAQEDSVYAFESWWRGQ